MSILYKLFGIPRTRTEFVEKAIKKGVKIVNLEVQSIDEVDYHVTVSLSAEGIRRLKMGNYFDVDFKLGQIEAEKEALKKARQVAEDLKGLGLFYVTINQKLVTLIEMEISRYEEICQEYKRIRTIIFSSSS